MLSRLQQLIPSILELVRIGGNNPHHFYTRACPADSPCSKATLADVVSPEGRAVSYNGGPMTFDPKQRSRKITDGRDQAGARAAATERTQPDSLRWLHRPWTLQSKDVFFEYLSLFSLLQLGH